MNIEEFNILFKEFLEKISIKFDSEKLRFYKTNFLMIKEIKPYFPVFLFMRGCSKYKKEIINRDESFFIKNDQIKENCASFDININSELINLEKLSNSEKAAIWDYIQSLFVLGENIKKQNKKIFDDYEKNYTS